MDALAWATRHGTYTTAVRMRRETVPGDVKSSPARVFPFCSNLPKNCALDNCTRKKLSSRLSERRVSACKESGLEETSSMYYSAAWTDSGFLLGCSHEHETIPEADSCIPCAGGYVVGVEHGVMRSLTAEEAAEFQSAHYAPRTDKLPLDAIQATLADAAPGDSRYAIMTRIRVGDHWTWATCMCFETYAKAVAHARAGNKVVHFRFLEWAALRQQAEVTPLAIHAPQASLPPRSAGEMLLEFVLRFLSAYGNLS